jgi:hypothetical protein
LAFGGITADLPAAASSSGTSLLGVERFVGNENVSLHVRQQVIGADQVMSLAPC